MTIASGRMATRVFSVSTSDSPFDTLEPCAEIDTVSAPRRLAAISKLTRVRVDASKNRFTTDAPAQCIETLERFVFERLEKLGAVEDRLDLGPSKLLNAEKAGFGVHVVVEAAASATESGAFRRIVK